MKKLLVQVSEVTSGNLDCTSTFYNDLMMFDAIIDRIEPTDLLDIGQFELIGRIANRWGVGIDEELPKITKMKYFSPIQNKMHGVCTHILSFGTACKETFFKSKNGAIS